MLSYVENFIMVWDQKKETTIIGNRRNMINGDFILHCRGPFSYLLQGLLKPTVVVGFVSKLSQHVTDYDLVCIKISYIQCRKGLQSTQLYEKMVLICTPLIFIYLALV